MRIAVLRGRGFIDDDREQATSVAIVNDAFARQFFGGVVPIGKRVGLCSSESCGPSATKMMEIVGVAGDAKYSNLRAAVPPIVYVPFTQVEQNLGEIQVRTAGDVSAVASTLYRALADVDRRLAIVGMMTARDRVDASLATQNMVAKVSSVFGLLALALAAVGLFGLVAYMTTQRTQEIGIRIALGAGRRDVRRLVLGNTVRLVALGAGAWNPCGAGTGTAALGPVVSGGALRSCGLIAQPRSTCLRGAGRGISAGTPSRPGRSDQSAKGRVRGAERAVMATQRLDLHGVCKSSRHAYGDIASSGSWLRDRHPGCARCRARALSRGQALS